MIAPIRNGIAKTSLTPSSPLAALLAETLVFAPHIDDDAFVYGALARAHALGCAIHVAVAGTGAHFQPHADRIVTVEERLPELQRATDRLGVASLEVGFPGLDGRLDTLPLLDVIGWMERVLARVEPTAVLLPVPSHHQDHRVVYEAGLAALRPGAVSGVQLIAAYEYPVSAVWPAPYPMPPAGALVIDVSGPYLESKLAALCEDHSQVAGRASNHPLHPDGVRKLAALRGLAMGVEHAEMLHVLQMAL
jgi:LmbE family N-acetylglucosaminyl deacetylase